MQNSEKSSKPAWTQVLQGVEETFNAIIEKQKITPTELKAELESLQDSFNLIFQKWSLEILYTIMLKDTIGFGEIKKTLRRQLKNAL